MLTNWKVSVSLSIQCAAVSSHTVNPLVSIFTRIAMNLLLLLFSALNEKKIQTFYRHLASVLRFAVAFSTGCSEWCRKLDFPRTMDLVSLSWMFLCVPTKEKLLHRSQRQSMMTALRIIKLMWKLPISKCLKHLRWIVAVVAVVQVQVRRVRSHILQPLGCADWNNLSSCTFEPPTARTFHCLRCKLWCKSVGYPRLLRPTRVARWP